MQQGVRGTEVYSNTRKSAHSNANPFNTCLCILFTMKPIFLVSNFTPKKRNRLAQLHLNELFFVKANHALRQQGKETMEYGSYPIKGHR